MGSPNTPEAERALLKVGDIVASKYRIERIVARGGMGIVYAAHHLLLDQRVALKVMLVGQDALKVEVIDRFVREAQAAARLHSEHVVRVMDVGALDNGAPFLVLEYLQGCDLEELLRLNGTLDPKELVDYILQALAALAQAHAADIIHRDIKPANIFLAVRPDGSNVIKVVDFGISKQPTSGARWRKLTGEASLGTPAYMSPEQLRSSQGVDARADIWSLGVVMYELLTGRIPFDGEGPGAAFAAILENDPDPIRAYRPDVSEELEEIIFRCLRRDREDRFADVGELARQLAVHGSGRLTSILVGIEETLTRSSRAGEAEGTPLEAAASAIALKSFPPPANGRMPSGSITISFEEPSREPASREATRKDDPTLKDPVPRVGPAGPPEDAKRSQARAWLWIGAGAVAVLAIIVLREVRGAQGAHGAASVVAAPPPPVSSALPSEEDQDSATAAPAAEDVPSSPAADPGARSPVPAQSAGERGPRVRRRPPPRPPFLRSRE
jgi:eukaryotic-like serine/threonine-protein kinase